MIQKIVDMQKGSKDLKEKLKGAINDLKSVIEFKEKHSSLDKEAFKNAIQINDDKFSDEVHNNKNTQTLKKFELLDNSDKILFLLYMSDWFLKRDKIKSDSKDKVDTTLKTKNLRFDKTYIKHLDESILK